MIKQYISLPSLGLMVGALWGGPVAASDLPQVDIGGAARFQYSWKDYDQASKDTAGDFEFELFRLNAKAKSGKFIFDAEYRWYADFEAVQHAYIGYSLNEQSTLKIGVHQVPFGIYPVPSHSFWASGNLFIGFENDSDSGIKYEYRDDGTMVDLAWYSGSEYQNARRYGRYSFDVVASDNGDKVLDDGELPFKESHTLNGRYIERLEMANGHVDVGGSVQIGQLYNIVSGNNNDHYALSVHLDASFNDWNVQLEVIDYEYDVDVESDTITMGAFGASYDIARKGQSYTANVAHTWGLADGPIKSLTCYNDFTYLNGDQLSNSIQNVTGCSLANDSVVTYIEWIGGRNMAFAGGNGVALQDEQAGQWHSRININIGYYF